ncbi:hypothetical protein [Spirilliplanes yamanashiensis]|uniref:Uncharacterized protein n=1 Tax=Spirilliplanes yamanashiensis TaxID=42233 RepID=A0A8J3Y4H1_9ACTN|nr:hypothetical protein [Spirilliplanes yamanashiensis]MDP9819795.1 hypothetical protein [Spirilliplanes yamanashiensis]GIJ01385.1 hypothetical protein Sya03_07370 [Spirilliplanes yamanashiensis]
MTEPLQNDPDRAEGTTVPDAQGEFVAEQPGGAFDPRSYRREGEDSQADGDQADQPG